MESALPLVCARMTAVPAAIKPITATINLPSRRRCLSVEAGRISRYKSSTPTTASELRSLASIDMAAPVSDAMNKPAIPAGRCVERK